MSTKEFEALPVSKISVGSSFEVTFELYYTFIQQANK